MQKTMKSTKRFIRRYCRLCTMFTRPWGNFYRERLTRIVRDKKEILDIGGGLRVDTSRSSRHDTHSWVYKLIQEERVLYKVLDYVDTYSPDIVGSIEDLPLPDSSQKAIVCLSVLEHVENPIQAAKELYRVLEPGGYCLVYVPFLFYYHAERGYYKDYWRFTEDSLNFMFKKFSTIEIQQVGGPLETFVRLTPLGKWSLFQNTAYLFDKLYGKLSSKQTSGYTVFLSK